MIENVEEFATRVSALLEVELDGEPRASDGLFDDWALDSLQAFQLILLVESLAGAEVAPMEIPAMFTVQDAYDYYLTLLEH